MWRLWNEGTQLSLPLVLEDLWGEEVGGPCGERGMQCGVTQLRELI